MILKAQFVWLATFAFGVCQVVQGQIVRTSEYPSLRSISQARLQQESPQPSVTRLPFGINSGDPVLEPIGGFGSNPPQGTAAEPQKKEEKPAEKKAEAKSPEDDLKMSAKWNNGVEFQSANKQFKAHFGGRVQLDSAWFGVPQQVNQNINIPYGNGVDFRRARLRADGTMYEFIDWAAEFDFVNSVRIRNQPISGTNPGFFDESVTAPTDLWIQFKDVPRFGQVRIGNQKEAIGFEHLVSSRFLPFMERSFNQDTFYGGTFNGFTPGIQATRNYGCDDMGVLQLGLFKPVNSVFAFSTGDGDYSAVGRITRLLQYDDEGRCLTHVGFSGRHATAVSQAGVPGRIQTLRTRDAIRAGLSQDWPVPAGINLFGDDMQWLNSEFVMVRGPWTLQSEYLFSNFHDARTAFGNPLGNSVSYHGGYIQLLRYLTDDFDHYNKKTGVFERVEPSSKFARGSESSCGGTGAWQVGGRYNFLDLNDGGLNGGTLHNFTLGLNWFLNPNLKFQWNYMATVRNVDEVAAFAAGSGVVHGFGTRMAWDF
jgi:phosphate-selective porin OprO and OprP